MCSPHLNVRSAGFRMEGEERFPIAEAAASTSSSLSDLTRLLRALNPPHRLKVSIVLKNGGGSLSQPFYDRFNTEDVNNPDADAAKKA